ncbi:flavin reductase family protein [Arthrobacter sulfonylureivorans]|uniref:flavin reductase family protein n=1 Tax=Arthrobacter sulfonylureivorans TaxID=2486855 RepID=UPI003BB1DB8A
MKVQDRVLEPARKSDNREYRNLLGQFATGVVLISTETAEGISAMTVNSFTSVSLNPKLVAFCPAKESATWARIRQSKRFGVSFLAHNQQDISAQYARRQDPREEFRDHWLHPVDQPVAAGSIGWLDCELESIVPAGDHDLVLAKVSAWSELPEGTDPLVFFGGAYRTIAPR